MALSPQTIRDLTAELADRLYIQIGGWHLYLGDAALAEPLAIECAARLDQGPAVCARQGHHQGAKGQHRGAGGH